MNAKKSVLVSSVMSVVLVGLAVGCGKTDNMNEASKADVNVLSTQTSDVRFPSGEPEADALGLTFAGAHCRIEIPVCRNGSIKLGSHIETTATDYSGFKPLLQFGAPYQDGACRFRAVQVARACGNAPGDVVRSKYVAPDGKVVTEKIGLNLMTALYTIRGFCAPTGLNTNVVDAEESWGIGYVNPELNLVDAEQRFQEIVAWCNATPQRTQIEYKVIQNGKLVFHRKNR